LIFVRVSNRHHRRFPFVSRAAYLRLSRLFPAEGDYLSDRPGKRQRERERDCLECCRPERYFELTISKNEYQSAARSSPPFVSQAFIQARGSFSCAGCLRSLLMIYRGGGGGAYVTRTLALGN